MSRHESEMAKIRRLIAKSNPQRALDAYELSRQPVNPATIDNFPKGKNWQHPGWPQMWPGVSA